MMNEDKIRDLLGLERTPGVPYEAYAVGKGIGSMSFDRLDAPDRCRKFVRNVVFRRTPSLAPVIDAGDLDRNL